MAERKNFRCKFSPYVTPENREGIIKSVMAQFEGYEATPEVTLLDNNEFIVSLELGGGLTSTLVRDKLLWSYFIDTVSAQDAIRRVQIIRLPQVATSWVTDQFTDPKRLNDGSQWLGEEQAQHLDGEGQSSYIIGDKLQSVHYADPRSNTVPGAFMGGEATDEDMTGEPSATDEPEDTVSGGIAGVFGASVRHGFETDLGTRLETNEPTDVTQGPTQPDGGTGLVDLASFFETKGRRGDTPGWSLRRQDSDKGPFGNIVTQSKEPNGPYEATLDVLGVEGEDEEHRPMGGLVHGSTIFGLNELDNYYESNDINDFDS